MSIRRKKDAEEPEAAEPEAERRDRHDDRDRLGYA